VHPAVQQAMRQRWHKSRTGSNKQPETEGDNHA
jgi:pantetheine-phosphate adenylyltransferase